VDSTVGPGEQTTVGSSPFFDGKTTRLEINGATLVVAVADDVGERAQGLMNVTNLGELDGMIFVFEQPRAVKFTMRNTLISLDIWFFDASGNLIGTHEMQPCVTDPCQVYESVGEVAIALETPLGAFDFALGDHVDLS
jgi:uncharacterized protein